MQSYVNTTCESVRVTILIISDLSGGKWCPQIKYMCRQHETLDCRRLHKHLTFVTEVVKDMYDN
jgi:hypothetical protein